MQAHPGSPELQVALPYNRRFKEFINVPHIKDFHDGKYPRDRIEEEFDEWHEVTEEFVKILEHETKRAS